MQMLMDIGAIHYGLLENEDLAEMAHVIGDAFSRFDPLGIAVGMTAEEIHDYILTFGPKAVTENLTVIARDPSGQLVGAMFSDDFATPPPDLTNLSESFAPVGALLDSLNKNYSSTQTIVPGSHVHFNMLAVLPAQVGNGIAQNLVRVCVDNASKRGYRYGFTEANGPASQHIFRKLGFRQRYTVSYQDFLFEGKPVFASIQSTIGTMLMEVNL